MTIHTVHTAQFKWHIERYLWEVSETTYGHIKIWRRPW